MSRIIDNMVAYRILSMLVQPFTDTAAYKHGIIDAKGNALRKSSTLKTDAERDAYTYLNRLVINLKKIINKVGGESRFKSMAAAMWLVKERYESGSRTTSDLQERFEELMSALNSGVHLVEEEILVSRFLNEDGVGVGAIGGAPTNNTSGPVSTQEPKIYPKSKKKPIFGMARRAKPLLMNEK